MRMRGKRSGLSYMRSPETPISSIPRPPARPRRISRSSIYGKTYEGVEMASDDAAWVTFDADKYLNDLIWGYVIDAIAKVELRAQMSDHLADTPNLAKPWCPTCQPDRDQMAEILEVSYCGIHQINFTAGSADALVPPPKNYSW